jgi:hypothetical protein
VPGRQSHEKAVRRSARAVFFLVRFFLGYCVMLGQREGIWPQALSTSFSRCLMDLIPGYPKLREHLGSVVAIMKLSSDWYDFRAKLDKLHPRYGKPTQLALEFADDGEPDTGKGL